MPCSLSTDVYHDTTTYASFECGNGSFAHSWVPFTAPWQAYPRGQHPPFWQQTGLSRVQQDVPNPGQPTGESGGQHSPLPLIPNGTPPPFQEWRVNSKWVRSKDACVIRPSYRNQRIFSTSWKSGLIWMHECPTGWPVSRVSNHRNADDWQT